MAAPLLEENGSCAVVVDYEPVKSFEEVRSVFWNETVKLWRIAGPIGCTIICNYGVNSVTNIFVGHIGELELSATTISLSLGMGSALETLCGQAFGAGQVFMLGVYMQRSWIILFVSCFFLLTFCLFAAPILKLLGQADEVADLAGRFTILVIPQLFSLAINFPTQKFLQARTRSLFLLILGLWLHSFMWDCFGSSFTLSIGLCYSISCFCVMLCVEIWYIMTLIILTGNLDNAVIAVDSLSGEAMLFIGINAAISVRVSNELGSGRPLAAKYSAYVTVFQSLLIGLFFTVVILITKTYYAFIFTSSKEVQQPVSRLTYLLGLNMALNSVQLVISGVAIGGGWQSLVAYSYYLFGLPIGFLLGYTANLGVEGLWGGIICGTALQTLLLLIVLYKTNWTKEVEQTTERMRKWGRQD
ncbi:hypothetical protein UlMin_036905 [Ulmus minor]